MGGWAGGWRKHVLVGTDEGVALVVDLHPAADEMPVALVGTYSCGMFWWAGGWVGGWVDGWVGGVGARVFLCGRN